MEQETFEQKVQRLRVCTWKPMTDEIRVEMRALYKAGVPINALVREFGYSRPTTQKVVRDQ